MPPSPEDAQIWTSLAEVTRTAEKASRNASRPQPIPTCSPMWSGSPSGSNRRDERRAQRRRRRRVEEAAEACREVLTEGWQETVAGRASNYVTEITWRRMFRGGRRRCKLLAELASAFLTGKKKAHDLVGSVAGWIASRVGAGEVTRTFAKELASAIPLPQEAKIVAVARG